MPVTVITEPSRRPNEAPKFLSMKCLGPLRALLAVVLLAACEGEDVQRFGAIFAGGVRPDVMPVMTNKELPFLYPTALYERKVQGNVTLRLWIDGDGRVQPESTSVAESSGYASFDSAAVKGSEQLRFSPAKLRGQPIPVTVLFPVYFRHPLGEPLPGDSILAPRPAAP